MKSLLMMLALWVTVTVGAQPISVSHDQFLQFWIDGDPSADINGDGTINSNDLLAYISRLEDCPVEPPVVEPPVVEPPVIEPPEAKYPTPHMKNVVRPGDLGEWTGGTWSFKPTDTLGYTIRRLGGEAPDGDSHVTFIGWDFDGAGRTSAWSALDIPDGSHIDFIDCTFRNGARSLVVECRADDDRNFHVRVFDSLFIDNYRDPRTTHMSAAFISPTIKSRGSTVGFYNTAFINSGTGPTDDIRNRIATWFDHGVYLNQNGKRAEYIGCVGINYASQFTKGGWQEVYVENTVMINGAFGGFFGADGGEQEQTGERVTVGTLKDVLIYGQRDLVAQRAPHSFGWQFQACDASLNNLIVANPNPDLDHNRGPFAFWLVSQGDRPIRVTGSGNRVFGYPERFASRGQYGHTKLGLEVTDWQAEVEWNDQRLPELDRDVMIDEIVSGRLRADEAFQWATTRLGL